MATSIEKGPDPAEARLPRSAREAEQQRALAATRRQATALLLLVTAVFVVVTLVGADGWLSYVQAAAEAGMVGGLADWFAVTVLFRHPLGIPVPHTAIIPERKDSFGETLGSFISDSFLTPETITSRVHSARVAERAASWLAEPRHSRRVAGHVLDGAVVVADLIAEEDVQTAIEDAIRTRVDELELAPTAGRILEAITRDGRHDEVVDSALLGVARYLEENSADLHRRFEQSSPWWLPGAVEDRIFGRLLDGARNVLDDMVHDRDHHLREELDGRIAALVHDLQHDADLVERGEQLKSDLMGQPALRDLAAGAWRDLKAELRRQAAETDSPLRERIAEAIAATSTRFLAEPALLESVQEGVDSGVRYVADHFHHDVADLVSQTISRWEGEETATRLELLLGPDLQFIRINGTVVGGMAGLVLHTAAQGLG